MSVKNEAELAALKRVGRVVADTLQTMLAAARPGITTRELDQIGEDHFRKFGAVSAPKLTYNFPGATCISVNHEAAHGIPGKRKLKRGDLVNIDVSLELDGYFADTGATTVIEPANAQLTDLVNASREILHNTVQSMRAGSPLNQIGRMIEQQARTRGYSVIKNLAGHGVGRALHEEPYDIVNYYNPRDKRKASRGLTLAIETFISTGANFVVQEADGWTLTTPDKSYVAQFEHSLVITDGEPIVLTA
jgi:methionyl aminopeptidase